MLREMRRTVLVPRRHQATVRSTARSRRVHTLHARQGLGEHGMCGRGQERHSLSSSLHSWAMTSTCSALLPRRGRSYSTPSASPDDVPDTSAPAESSATLTADQLVFLRQGKLHVLGQSFLSQHGCAETAPRAWSDFAKEILQHSADVDVHELASFVHFLACEAGFRAVAFWLPFSERIGPVVAGESTTLQELLTVCDAYARAGHQCSTVFVKLVKETRALLRCLPLEGMLDIRDCKGVPGSVLDLGATLDEVAGAGGICGRCVKINSNSLPNHPPRGEGVMWWSNFLLSLFHVVRFR